MRLIICSIFLINILCSCLQEKEVQLIDEYDFTTSEVDHNSIQVYFERHNEKLDSFTFNTKNYSSVNVYEVIENKYWSCDLIEAQISGLTDNDRLIEFYENCINRIITQKSLDFNDIRSIGDLVKKINPTLISSLDDSWQPNIDTYYDKVVSAQRETAKRFDFDVCERIYLKQVYKSINRQDVGAVFFTTNQNYNDFDGYNYGIYHKEFLQMNYGYIKNKFVVSLRDLSLSTRTIHFE